MIHRGLWNFVLRGSHNEISGGEVILGVFTMTETTRKQLVNKITNDFPKQKLFINISEKRVNNRCLAPVLIRSPEAVAKFKQKQKQLVKQPDPKLTRLPPRHIIGSL